LVFVGPAVAQDDYPTRTITLIVLLPARRRRRCDGAHRRRQALRRARPERPWSTTAAAAAAISAPARSPSGAGRLHPAARHTGTISINPTLYANPGYDPQTDFSAIGMGGDHAVALMAHPSFPAKTVAEVIALARQEPAS